MTRFISTCSGNSISRSTLFALRVGDRMGPTLNKMAKSKISIVKYLNAVRSPGGY